MKKLSKLFFITFLFIVGFINVKAAPFKIGETEYETLKAAVEAAPTDNTLTIIEMTEDVTLAPGVQVVAGKNLVIDFGGHSYETWEPMVGSTGTKTQSFQLLKGSTVYMKNGTLIASTHENSKMFIQNYSDLTLDNITIDATPNTYDAFYAVSSNNGEVVFRGNTNIKVNRNTHAKAFDMCWAPNKGYPDGTQITVDTTGLISGIIELDLWGTWEDDPKSKLLIKNGNFNVTWDIDERLEGQLSIEGGSFNSSVDEYVTGNNNEYTEDGETYVVLPSATVNLNEEEIFVLKGKTYTINPTVTQGYAKYVKFGITDKNIATFSNNVITGLKSGTTTLNYNLGRLGGSVDVTVYEVKPAEAETEIDEEINEEVTSVTTTLIEQALSNETVEGIDKDTIDNLKEAVIAGKTVETNVDIEEVKKDDIEKEAIDKIEEVAERAEGEIVGYLNIDVILQANGDDLGKVTKLPEPITVTIDVDSSLGNVPENTTRKYFIVRLHDGEEPELIEAEYKDGKLSFKTDRFSQYAYGYTDTENKTEEGITPVANQVENTNIPKTGDSIRLFITLFLLSSLGIAGTILLSKKRLVSITK